MERKIVFIINPVAGKGETIKILPIIKEKMQDFSGTYEIHISRNIGDITKTVKCHYEKGCREFVAIGGDGSLFELINGLNLGSEDRATIGILPLGSGNDFIRNVTEGRNLDNLFNSIINNNRQLIDVGKVNDHYFINVCSCGIDGQIIQMTDRLKQKIPGQIAYLTSTLKAGITFKPSPVTVVVDGTSFYGKLMLIAVGNGRYFGGGMKVCPEAQLNDGEFEICIVSDTSKLKFMRKISKIYSGRLGEVEEVQYLKGREIEVYSEGEPYIVNADGNLIDLTPMKISMIPGAVYFFTEALLEN